MGGRGWIAAGIRPAAGGFGRLATHRRTKGKAVRRRLTAGLTALLVVFAASAAAAAGPTEPLTIVSETGRHVFQVEIADEPAERAHGLMNRFALAPDAGMLFDFGATEPVYMWMKNTYIPLDMIFVRADGVIHRIAANTVPHSLATISSGQPVRFVIELPGGTAAKLGIKRGDWVEHPLMGGG